MKSKTCVREEGQHGLQHRLFPGRHSRPASAQDAYLSLPAIDRRNGCLNLIKEESMHDILIGLAYVGMVIGPAVLATVRTLEMEKDV